MIFLALGVLLAGTAAAQPDTARPNVLWIDIDDQSPWYSSYGHDLVETPNIDALAREGVLFERAYAPTPVCSPTRSSLVTGSYAIRIGAHDHRSGRVPDYRISLPEGVVTVPELFRAAGYETYNASKDDFNFVYDRTKLYTIGPKPSEIPSWKGPQGGGHWRDVSEGKPFFGQTKVAGGKNVTNIAGEVKALGRKPVGPADVPVPAQYPDVPQVRRHIADHYNSILRTDHQVGELVAQLKADGLWESTVLVLFSDHGSDLPRSKEFSYDEGLRIPLIVVAPGLPEIVKPGTRRTDLVNLMDIAATSLALAGLDVPDFMDARNVFGPDYHRDYVFTSADRMSNVIDRVRSVVGPRFHYIRNFLVDRPLINWGHREMIDLARDPDASSFLTIRRLAEEGKLTPAQAAPYGQRVAEELYDLESDPDEVVNLAGDPAHADVLNEMREALAGWIEGTDDKGQYPRSRAAMHEITERFARDWLRSPEFRDLP
ncbi:MAG: sulfatase [Acidobacteriota bacterium]|nr:sulfatase [Acidobacteriota bacterium]MDE2924337.1 sulfatase [Acidobacteriota bacterium]MDE3263987.1 sulfatase [Acidobacteriota bacterium]